MTDVILFHHALGLTAGLRAFAEQLGADGHRVIVPDLFEGVTFDTVDEGVKHAEAIGFEEIIARGVAAAEALPADLVYAGLSLGVMPAQRLAQTRPGAKGALFMHGALPVSTYSTAWPAGVPLQMHVMEQDDLGDVDVARELARSVEDAELYLYPGAAHLFTDAGSDGYDPESTRLVLDRARAMLRRVSG